MLMTILNLKNMLSTNQYVVKVVSQVRKQWPGNDACMIIYVYKHIMVYNSFFIEPYDGVSFSIDQRTRL